MINDLQLMNCDCDTYDLSQVIISGSSDSTVRVWDVECGEMVSDVTFKFNSISM